MNLVGAISTAVLSLTLLIGIPAYAQQEQHEQEENKDKSAQEKEKKARPEKSAKQDEKNVQQQESNIKKENQEERNAHEQRAPEVKPSKQNESAHANGSGRIPEDRFRAHFGREHRFRVSQADYSNRRFQYGGYWFGFVQTWPSNWLYTQDVYVVEIDGVYYLCNANYPGVNITLSVTL